MRDDSIIMLDHVLSIKGDVNKYPVLAEIHKENYRTLNGFLFQKLKEHRRFLSIMKMIS